MKINCAKLILRGQKMKKIILSLVLSLSVAAVSYGAVNTQVQKHAPTPQKTLPQATAVQEPIISTTSLKIVANPKYYLNKTVKMSATFDKFSTLGLDYKKAMRDSKNYIGILIQRDDVTDHDIPLSEMKLFLTKELAEKNINLDTGDKIEITAHVFSTALGYPWLDVKTLTLLKKAKENKEKEDIAP